MIRDVEYRRCIDIMWRSWLASLVVWELVVAFRHSYELMNITHWIWSRLILLSGRSNDCAAGVSSIHLRAALKILPPTKWNLSVKSRFDVNYNFNLLCCKEININNMLPDLLRQMKTITEGQILNHQTFIRQTRFQESIMILCAHYFLPPLRVSAHMQRFSCGYRRPWTSCISLHAFSFRQRAPVHLWQQWTEFLRW